MMSENYFSDSKIQVFSLLGCDSDIRVIFPDIGSTWFKGFILDSAFLRFVRNISLYIGIIYANVRVSEIPQNQYQGNKRYHS